MANRDSIHRFLFENFPVRGEIVHLDATWQAVLERFDYPPHIRTVLGELMAATALLASTLKFSGMLTVQLQGKGPLHLLVVQCSNRMALRGLARWNGDVPVGTLSAMTGDGRLAITVESPEEGHRYQGIVPLEGETIADCLQNYFRDSVQLPTRLWTATGAQGASGMLLQRLPQQPGQSNVESDDWNRVQILADTITADELQNLADEVILRRLFNEDDIRLFESAPVSFRCGCSRERVERMLRGLGREEVESILEDEGKVEVRCEFCNKAEDFDRVDAIQLFEGEGPPPPAGKLH
ncbi:MAG: Hsp33 family molecular chaperone HslO [Gammaproteobacteria bacterium]|nr:Hsp33 family molecular chaperone HslO [Gammaproteobacteria bacterium]